MRNKNRIKLTIALLGFVLAASGAFAQHRGDALDFQGLDQVNNKSSARAVALGGAFSAVTGDVEALFHNPAALLGMSGLQFSVDYSSSNKLWRETQDYRPNRQLVTIAFVLDGLYQPNPAFNGWIDNEAFFEDSTYIVDEPLLGVDPYSEEAADWKKELDNSGLNNLAVAYPFQIANRNYVVSAGMNRQLVVSNYDRNITHLSPHIAYHGYNDMPERVTGADDSVHVNWSDYERQRSGPLQNFTVAFAGEAFKNIKLGFGINKLSGETDDLLALNRIGNFDLVQGYQIYKFSYDTLNVQMSGTSTFSATSFDIGMVISLGRLNLGMNLTPGHTLTREWKYDATIATADSTGSEAIGGKDELDMPFAYRFGASVRPVDNFLIAFDIAHNTSNAAYYDMVSNGAVEQKWADKTSWGLGVQYDVTSNFALLGGYRIEPQVFIPDGSADLENGPDAEAYSLGASLTVSKIRLDFAWQRSKMQYFDAYFSNTNFAYESQDRLLSGVTLVY